MTAPRLPLLTALLLFLRDRLPVPGTLFAVYLVLNGPDQIVRLVGE